MASWEAGCHGSRDVVWHPHGGVELAADRNERFVLSQSDYDALYPTSRVAAALENLVKARRVVYFGFGFSDPDLRRLLEFSARFLDSFQRPAYAFLGFESEEEQRAACDRLRYEYCVEVIPYFKRGHDHSDLIRVMNAYDTFIVGRNMALGQRINETPDYDPVVTSFQIHSRLCSDPDGLPPGTKVALCRAWIISRLHSGGEPQSKASLLGAASEFDIDEDTVVGALRGLTGKKLATVSNSYISLTEAGRELSAAAKAKVELQREQFRASVRHRAGCLERLGGEAQHHVAMTACSFFEELCRERGLGVAQSLLCKREGGALRTALVQSLRDRIAECPDRDEAFGTITLAMEVIRAPTPREAAYLGSLTQAYFGQHLLGATERTREIERAHLGSSMFVFDSNVLIAAIARGCDDGSAALRLLERLRDVGGELITTRRLATEVLDHLTWGISFVRKFGHNSSEALDLVRGARGYRPNLLVEGLIQYQENGHSLTLGDYLRATLALRPGAEVDFQVVADAIAGLGVAVKDLDEWDDFDQLLYDRRDLAQAEIRQRREQANTFKGYHQTLAEAEVAIIVSSVQRAELARGLDLEDCCFVSTSRVIDGLSGLSKQIVILPASLHQWLLLTQPVDEGEAAILFDALLAELSTSGVKFVKDDVLRSRFSGVIAASKSQLSAVKDSYRDIFRQRLGPDPEKGLEDVNPLDLPFLAGKLSAESLAQLSQRVKTLEAKKGLSDTERQDYDKLRHEKEQRRARHARRMRSAKSKRPKSGKKGRKRRRS